ncbi:MAG: hypothetical protein RIS64_723 [Bacteroidota bacterium]
MLIYKAFLNLFFNHFIKQARMKNYYLLLCCLLSIQSFGFNTDGKLLFCARMYGSNEVPAVSTTAKGLATFLVQEDYMTVQVNAVFDSLSGAVTGCHIHTGAAGQNGGVAINLSSNVVGNRLQTQITFTKAQLAMAIDGGLYLNVHTVANPNGEIRAQLRLEKDNNYMAMLSGANQVPAVNTTAAGLGAFTLSYDQTKLDYKIVVNGLSGAIASAHLHFGAAGVAGGVAYALTASGNVLSGSLSVNSAFLDSLKIGAIYVNIHTAANPNGEIRGQLSVQQGIQHNAFLEGAQEVPAVSTNAIGLAIASIYSTLDTMSYAVLYTGVTPTSAHLHQGVMGMNGGVVFALTPSPSVTNLYTGLAPGVTAIMVKAALQDGFYFNIHSTANPNGEIRGQVLSTVRESFVTSLCGSQQVPSLNSRAIGLGMMSINRMQDNAHIMFVNNGLSGNASAAHLHTGAAGATGGVLYDLSAMTGNAFFGYTAMTPANAMTIMMGNTYYNVHTAANANGEVRGQLGKSANQCSETTEMPNSDAKLLFASRLNGANQVPTVVTAAKGLATFMVQEDYMTVNVNAVFDSLSGAVTGCHIHSGAAGQTGGVLIDLSSFVRGNRIQTTLTFTKAQLAAAIDNGLYLNVHTAANPNGEIRAQLRLEKDNNYMALLSGANQVPAVSTTAAGLGAFTLSYSQAKLDYKIVVNGLSGDIASAHLHFGGTGVAGGVAYTLTANGNVLMGSLDVNQMFLDSLTSGKVYVNVHTAANPNGEIRAQLMPQRGIQHDAFLEGAQGTPFVATNAKGLGLVSINSTLDTLSYNVLYTGLTPTAAHIHTGTRGMAGGVVTTLATSPTIQNYYTGTATGFTVADINTALKSGWYFNIHTAANPNGEIRGQIYPTVREGLITSMCGAQEAPAVVAPSYGLGMMSINRNKDNAHAMFVVDKLTGNATSAHVHKGAVGVAGGVLYPLTMVSNAFFGYINNLMMADVNTIVTGGTYFNVHTAMNPGGEVRGQLGKIATVCNIGTSVVNVNGAIFNVKTFPNPTFNDVTVGIESPKAFEATVSVLDVTGRNVLTTLHTVNVGENRLELPTGNLTTGIYFIQIKNNVELIVTQKIVKE